MIGTRRFRLRTWLLLGGLGMAGAGAAVFWHVKASETHDLNEAREMAGLAPYPPTARDIHVYRNSHFFWTGYYVRFTAPGGEINAFLASLPGLKGKSPEVFSPQHRYLPLPAGRHVSEMLDSPDVYFEEYGSVVKNSAPWFDRAIRQAGRRYHIDYHGNSGELVVNDASHTVFLYVYDS